jgi:hypothetical protein
MKLKPPHKRHVKIPKKRRSIRSEVKMSKANEMMDLIERADEYLSTIKNKGNCGPHHLVSDMRACLAAQADTPTIDNTPSCGQENDYRRALPQRSQEPVAYRWRMRSAIDPSYVSYWSFGAEHPKIPEGLPCDIEPLYADTRPDRERQS